MSKSYKYSRSRKPITLEDAELRLTDCIKKMETVILDGDYDIKDIQAKQQAIYAMSNAINRLIKVKDALHVDRRLSKIEDKMKINQ